MSIRTILASRIAGYITSTGRLEGRRRRAERRRIRQGRAHQIDYFHCAADPYSHLTVQLLGRLAQTYDVGIRPWLAPPPPDWAAPERTMLDDYARRDCVLLAQRAGLEFSDPGAQPSGTRLSQAEDALAAILSAEDFSSKAFAIGRALWSGEKLPAANGMARPVLEEAASLRAKLGHYLGAMLHYEGEWYWGIDRLHYLEERLTALGARREGGGEVLLFRPPSSSGSLAPTASAAIPEVHFYLSFRSPYTYIAAQRIRDSAAAFGAGLKLRYVLPMVMRGLPVPRMKSFYITSDVAREAQRLGLPFGLIADPVGEPVERGYAILPMAIEEGLGFEFCMSFLRGVWAEGIDAGSDRGLEKIVGRAGLDWARARQLIGGNHWQAQAEANRREMMELGLWGVPCFRIGSVSAWGQDRIWVIEDELRRQYDCQKQGGNNAGHQ